MIQSINTDRTKRPNVQPVPLLPIPTVERYRLSNGIEVVTLDAPSETPVVRILFSWENGGFDVPHLPAAQLAVPLMLNGNSHLSAAGMADLIDYTGTTTGTDLSSHNNSVTLLTLQRNLDKVLPAIIDSINEPLFPIDEFNTLKERLAASRATELNQVSFQAGMLDTEQCFGPNHPASRTYWPDSMRATSIELTREAHALLKGSQPPMVFVVGSLTKSFVDSLNKNLEAIHCDPGSLPAVEIVQPYHHSQSSKQHHEMEKALQSAIRISVPTIKRSHPDYQDLRLTTIALGGYFGSRLMTNIREEKGLTYGINSGLYGYREGSFLTISSQCDNRYVEQVIDEVEKEIDRLATESMSREELDAVKQTATASLLSMLDTPFNVMDYYVTQRQVHTPPDYFALQQKAIMELTPEKIMDITRKYLIGQPRIISTAGKSGS